MLALLRIPVKPDIAGPVCQNAAEIAMAKVPQHQLYENLAQVGRALGNGSRLELLERLAQAEASVETLAQGIGLTTANASQHLQNLRRAGLVTARRESQQMIYRLTDERTISLIALMRDIAETNLAEVERMVSRVFGESDSEGALEPISRETLKAGIERGELTLLDVRPSDEYWAGHLPGAIHAPLDELDRMLESLPKNEEIVAYCRGPYCALSHEAVQRLRQLGFRVRRFDNGVAEWRAAGLPIETGERAASQPSRHGLPPGRLSS